MPKPGSEHDPIDYAVELVTAAQIADSRLPAEETLIRLHKDVGVELSLGLTVLCGRLLHRLRDVTGAEPLQTLQEIAREEQRERSSED